MRRVLDSLYRLSGTVAAVFLLAICGTVLLQVGANMIDSAAALLIGKPIGLAVPSYSGFTGYLLVTASFSHLPLRFPAPPPTPGPRPSRPGVLRHPGAGRPPSPPG